LFCALYIDESGGPGGAAPGGIVEAAIDADGGRRAPAGVALGRRLRLLRLRHGGGGEEAEGGEAWHWIS
jgi:hypothetical protein